VLATIPVNTTCMGATPPLFGYSSPCDVVFDTSNGNIYTIGMGGPSGLPVISGATNSISGYVPLSGYYLEAAAYDPANGDIYISSEGKCNGNGIANACPGGVPLGCPGPSCSSSVIVVSGATDKVIADINLTISCNSCGIENGHYVNYALYQPYGLAYDPADEDMIVVAHVDYSPVFPPYVGTNTLFIISSTTNEAFYGVDLGHGPEMGPWGVAYDSSNGYMYVTMGTSIYEETASQLNGNVLVVRPGHLILPWAVVGNVSVGVGPNGISYGPGSGDIYVAITGSQPGAQSVSVISGLTNWVTGNIPINCGGCTPWGVVGSDPNGDVYVSSSACGVSGCQGVVTVIWEATNTVVATVNVGGFYGSAGIAGAMGITYDSDNHDIYVAGGSGGQAAVSVIGTPPGLYVSASVSIYGSVPSSAATLEVGQNNFYAHLISTASGGVPPYSYQWYINGTAASGGTGQAWNFVPPTAPASYTITVVVTDSHGTHYTSNTVTVTVVPGLSACQIGFSYIPGPGHIGAPSFVYLGDTSSTYFTYGISGGTPPFTYQWYLNGWAIPAKEGGTGFNVSIWTTQPYPATLHLGQNTVEAKVTDSHGTSVACNTLQFTLVLPTSVSVSPGSTTEVNYLTSSITFTATASGGVPPYGYEWFADSSPVGSGGSQYTFTPPNWGWGVFWIVCQATDSNGYATYSNDGMVYVIPVSSIVGIIISIF